MSALANGDPSGGHFTSSGRLSSWVEPNGDEFTRLYDPTGRVEEEVDALGNRTVYGYDAAGRLSAITDVTLNATTMFDVTGLEKARKFGPAGGAGCWA